MYYEFNQNWVQAKLISAVFFRHCTEARTIDGATVVICHRELSIVMQTYNSLYGMWFFLFKLLWIFIAIIVGSRAIVLHSVREMVVAPVVTALLFYTTQSMGNLYEASRESKHACAGMRRSDPYAYKCLKVYERYIRANVGEYYYADSFLCLSVLTVIVQGVASLVLGTRSN